MFDPFAFAAHLVSYPIQPNRAYAKGNSGKAGVRERGALNLEDWFPIAVYLAVIGLISVVTDAFLKPRHRPASNPETPDAAAMKKAA